MISFVLGIKFESNKRQVRLIHEEDEGPY